ncbi:MAG: hypothetical protein AB8G15_20375, partial [Saprospiraceae bacterium]
KEFSDRENAHLYCSKNMAIAKVLVTLSVRSYAIEICHKILKKALHFELTDYVIDTCFILRSHYAVREGNIKKFDYYNQLLKDHLSARIAEILAGELYLKILIPHIKKKFVKKETHEQAVDAFQQLKPYLDRSGSPYLHYIALYIESLTYSTINDYLNTIEVCKKAVYFFEQKNYNYNTAIKAFLHQQILCYTQLKMYKEGKSVIEKNLAILHPGSYNWYVSMDLHLILAIHSQEYQEAYYAFNKAINHKKFKQLNDRTKEKWVILESYLQFLAYVEKITPIPADNRFRKFKMGKFLNSVPTFSKDKRGMNIPILIIHIVFMIVKKDYDGAINRIGAIEKYCTRYVRRDENFRSNCFIKMLLQIPISSFHKAGITRKSKKYLEQLQSEPLEVSRQANEIEIIPYEDLWEMILEALDHSFYLSKKEGR